MSTGTVEELTTIISAMEIEPEFDLVLSFEDILTDMNNLTDWFLYYHCGDEDFERSMYFILTRFNEIIDSSMFKECPVNFRDHSGWNDVRELIIVDFLDLPSWFKERFYIEYIAHPDEDFLDDLDEICLSCGNNSVVDGTCWLCPLSPIPDGPTLIPPIPGVHHCSRCYTSDLVPTSELCVSCSNIINQ